MLLKEYSRNQRKTLQLYFRCLSNPGINSMLAYYYIPFEFQSYERWLRNSVLRKTLAYWEVKDEKSLKDKVKFLLKDGFCEEYKHLHTRLFALSTHARERYIEESKDQPEFNKLAVVHKSMSVLPSADIAAVGGGWSILLSRVGLAYRFLTKEEAWQIKLDAAQYLQLHYKNWQEYLTAFAVGTQYLNSDVEMKKSGHALNTAGMLLGSTLAVSRAPWKQNLLPETNGSLKNI